MGFYMDNILHVNDDTKIKKASQERDMYKFIFTTSEGKDIEYEIILTFKNKVNNKIYYIVTDNTRSRDNELNITAFYVNYDNNEDDIFYPVTDDNELKMVFDVFNKVKNDL